MVGPPYFGFEYWGVAPARPCPADARFECGDGRLSVARHAVDIPARIAGGRGKFTASGRKQDFARNGLTLNEMGVDVPL